MCKTKIYFPRTKKNRSISLTSWSLIVVRAVTSEGFRTINTSSTIVTWIPRTVVHICTFRSSESWWAFTSVAIYPIHATPSIATMVWRGAETWSIERLVSILGFNGAFSGNRFSNLESLGFLCIVKGSICVFPKCFHSLTSRNCCSI